MLTQKDIKDKVSGIQKDLNRLQIPHTKECPQYKRNDQKYLCRCGASAANGTLLHVKANIGVLFNTLNSDEYIMDRACILIYGEDNCNCEE